MSQHEVPKTGMCLFQDTYHKELTDTVKENLKMSTLSDRLKRLTESEIDDTLEAAIIEKVAIMNEEIELLSKMEDPALTETKIEELKADLPEVQKRVENKQNEIDLIRAVSLEKIRATATSSTKLSNLDRP